MGCGREYLAEAIDDILLESTILKCLPACGEEVLIIEEAFLQDRIFRMR